MVGDAEAGAGPVMTHYCVYRHARMESVFVRLSVLFDTPFHALISFPQMISAVLMPGVRQ